MNLKSSKIIINKSDNDIFDFLSDLKNFQQLMPSNTTKFETKENGSILFALKGMPEINLKKKEATPYHKIILGAAGGKLDFSLIVNFTKINPSQTEVQLFFSGEFNKMMEMMVKKPISAFIETLTNKMNTIK